MDEDYGNREVNHGEDVADNSTSSNCIACRCAVACGYEDGPRYKQAKAPGSSRAKGAKHLDWTLVRSPHRFAAG
jgi:hypothetical protein